MSDAVIRRRLVVTGHVQGVFFRASVQEAAANAGVAGSASNLADGSVEVVLEGPAASVESVVGYCRLGPAIARVDHVAVHEEYPEGLEGFLTR